MVRVPFVCLVLLLTTVLSPLRGHADVILYVAAGNKAGANNGSSWINSFRGPLGLQNALQAAYPIAASGTQVQIWVAKGTYRPTAIRTEVETSFVIKSRIKLYGGFIGTETLLTQRNVFSNPTVLSGVLDSASYETRSLHIVFAENVDASSTISGFTITGAYQWYGSNLLEGGGLQCINSQFVVDRCLFLSNYARGGGGASVTGGHMTFADCTFMGNRAGPIDGTGGGLRCKRGISTLKSCTFDGNSAGGLGNGGALECDNGTLSATDCTFANGTAEGGGAAYCTGRGLIELSNCSITNNRVFSGAGGIGGSGLYRVKNCSFVGNRATSAPGAGSAIGGVRGIFANCLISDNISTLQCVASRPGSLFINCLFRHNSGGRINEPLYSLSDTALVNCVFVDNAVTSGPCMRGVGMTLINSTAVNNGGHPTIQFVTAEDKLLNCIVYDGRPGASQNEAARVGGHRNAQIRYCTIQGWSGVLGGVGNNGMNPLFVDPVGPDGVAGTGDEDWRLLPLSPCIDSADSGSLPPDAFDLDGDGNFTEPLPLDFDGNPRVIDNPLVSNTGVGQPPFLDRGAYERVPPPQATAWTAASGTFNDPANWMPVLPTVSSRVYINRDSRIGFLQNAAIDQLIVIGCDSFWRLGSFTVDVGTYANSIKLIPADASPTSLRIRGGIVSAPQVVIPPDTRFGGNTTVLGSVFNGGIAFPSSDGELGTLNIQGTYQQLYAPSFSAQYAGELDVKLLRSGNGYAIDQVLATHAALSGKLLVQRAADVDPPVTPRLARLLNAETGTGRFDVAVLPAFPAGSSGDQGRFFYVSYDESDQGYQVYLNVGTLRGPIIYGDPSSQPVNGTPSAVATGDITGDGLPDLAIALPQSSASGSVLVFKNLGVSGGQWLGWSQPDQYPVGRNPQGLAIADLDGLPGAEIAVANKGYPGVGQNPPDPGSVTILVNTPANQGTFTVRTLSSGLPPLTDNGSFPVGIAIAELEGGAQSLPEIALALSGNPGQSIVLENEDDLVFEPCPIPTGPYPFGVAIADLNGDGLLDLAYCNSGGRSVSVRFNDPMAPMGFQNGPDLLVGDTPLQVIAADLNADGRPELITRNSGDNTISILRSSAPDQFAPSVSLSAGSVASPLRDLAVLDMDTDGDPDIAYVQGQESQVRVYRNDVTAGELGFALLNETIPTEFPVSLLTSADVAGDGRIDLIPIVIPPTDAPPRIQTIPSKFRSHCFTANCDGSTAPPVLNANDFLCFVQLFGAGNPRANCDESSVPPVLNAADFTCFLNEFTAALAEGCP